MRAHLSPRPLPTWADPERLFRALAARAGDVFWLDAGDGAAEGWSLMGVGVPSPRPDDVRLDGPAPEPGLPPFLGGWVGWCAYEGGAAAAGAPVSSDDPVPDGWMRVTHAIAWDHARHRLWALDPVGTGADPWADELLAAAVDPAAAPPDPAPETTVARHTPAEYAELIERCRALIRAGVAYQLCLTTRFTVPGTHDPVEVYRRLRSATPAHHGGFVRIGGRALLSASPEQFLHAAGGVVRTRPIKGTRPRSTDPDTDAALAAELAGDPKERAENVMIVDLMRNDLSRVCVPGTIRVDGLWVVESYPAVHQLVSTVSGTLADGVTLGALLAAAFPAGSMTGAPKLSAMTRLHELESGPRGVYAGCFGYVGVDGAVDLAMVIRSIVIAGDEAVVGAGGGITWGSVPAAEVAEVATKARAPLAALGAEPPWPWGSDILN
ncbi:anthranilate synthase component I family protein [Microbacterium sufflavum]|uniref:Chorismate-binding protein n=1 Tax=Microbacterium sufflavum TaxID=2851649 RepID=A0ABY4IM34_9MICO|nr:chorismate-binding protein [Microbacterium sufflavum]UPL12343.1 chorismate-binding protein [Microbacterium sufflavum]